MNPAPPAYVGFGMLTPVAILVVDQLPEHNTGALIKEVSEFIFDDAAIVACLLRQWDVSSAIIGTSVGDNSRGHQLARQLNDWGVQGQVAILQIYPHPLRGRRLRPHRCTDLLLAAYSRSPEHFGFG